MSVPSAAIGAQQAPAVPAGLAIVVLALLLSIQPVTTDLYLPALPALTRSLNAPVAAGQLTLSALLLAFGCSQLAWGPLSDRFGRRPVLLTGLAMYTLAAVGAALAPSMAVLIAWRTAQGVAMGAVVMCARAIVRDLYTPLAGARAMSKALTGLGLVACLCAPLGGLHLIYSLNGVYLAQSVLALPVIVALSASAIRDLPAGLLDQARAFHASRLAIGRLAVETDSMGLCAFARSDDPVYYLAVRAWVGAPAQFEDAASGAANATLAAWLASRDALPGDGGSA